MCLIIEQKFETRREAREFSKKPLIAQKNIRVYKILEKDQNIFVSPYRGFTYTQGKQYSVKFSFDIDINHFSYKWEIAIKKGLHVFTSSISATEHPLYSPYARNLIIVEMYIPKGALYFKAKNTIVSTELVFKPLPKKTIK